MTPKDRDALIEAMAWALIERMEDSDVVAARRAARVLDALESYGCAVVPIEATWEMKIAGRDDLGDADISTDDAGGVHTAMLQASPYRKE